MMRIAEHTGPHATIRRQRHDLVVLRGDVTHTMNNRAAYLIVLALIVSTSAVAQQNTAASKSVSDQHQEVIGLQTEIIRLKADLAAAENELTTCRGGTRNGQNGQRVQAIASLEAVRTALRGGANSDDFSTRQWESRIEVDALPETKENVAIRNVSNLYRDAVWFGLMRTTGIATASDVENARSKYKDDADLTAGLVRLRPNVESSGHQHDINQVIGEYMSSVLILKANQELDQLEKLDHLRLNR